MKPCFSSTYLAPLAWTRELLKYSSADIEAKESWQKQSFRNRAYLSGPQGLIMLNIPVDHQTTGGTIDEVRISYRENWQHNHWQAIKSAYGSSPFFESLSVELEPFYRDRYTLLLEFNNRLLQLILDWLQSDLQLSLTDDWVSERPSDYREAFHPKPEPPSFPEYPQVFQSDPAARGRLSVLDLLFNEGRAAHDYLVS